MFYYCVGSLQGSVEALRTTNHYWHFTDFTVGHSHITMYGFVGFLIWGGIYGLIPRLTDREPPHTLVGVHFWLAFVGLLLYAVSMSVGGTIQGMTWMTDAPFIQSFTASVPYWTWRAVGGTLMFSAHLLFAYNVWRMRPRTPRGTSPNDEEERDE
ncbi:MAG: cbb3-type cytochrome c oxidase subunit I [Bradymonadaceae bacterium]